MSFSSRTKDELARIYPKNSCCRLAELAALIRMTGTLQLTNGGRKLNIKLTTENAAVARKLFKFFKTLFNIHVEVMIKKNLRLRKSNHYLMIVTNEMDSNTVLQRVGILKKNSDSFDIYRGTPIELLEKRCCKRAYLRGAFLGGGSVSDPEKTYHLEFVNHSLIHSESLRDLINSFGLKSKIIKRKGNYVVYLKEGDQVVDLLNIIGAHSALLSLENIRIYKQMRNDVNRIVNCETANLGKIVNASIRQIENIKYIEGTVGLGRLPLNLREIAQLRLKNRDASLKELGKMLNPPIGKSGVNHRLRKIEEIANNLKGNKR
ncbi:MAG TPA: DNA-binding protein WhiA [Oscillospiraceae bacterium]|nr:DNA-binding protein WhiA [Oscillospiraceae bacterium]